MPPLSLTHLKYASVERPISEKSVPGCFVLSAPILIGAPLAFWPLPSPHLDVGPAALAGVEVSFAPPPLLLSLLSPQAATREATPPSMTTSPASDRGVFQPNPVITVLLLLGLLESNALAMRSLRAQRYVRRTLLGRPTRCQGVTPGGSGTGAARVARAEVYLLGGVLVSGLDERDLDIGVLRQPPGGHAAGTAGVEEDAAVHASSRW